MAYTKLRCWGVRPRRPNQNAKFPPLAAAGPLKDRPSVGHWGSIIPAVRLGEALRSARERERDSGPSPQSPFWVLAHDRVGEALTGSR